MKNRRVAILSALALMIAVVANPLLAAGPDGTGRPADDTRGVERPVRATVILDGVPFAPGELKRSGKSLIFVHTREGQEKGVVHAFTSPEVADEFMRRVFKKDFGVEAGVEADHTFTCAPGYPPYYQWHEHFSVFNKDVGCTNSDNLAMHEGMEYPNLDFDGWNNRISCVKAACIPKWTTLYSCRFYDMTWDSNCQDPDSEVVEPGLIVYDLNQRQFNNRASSLRFCTNLACVQGN